VPDTIQEKEDVMAALTLALFGTLAVGFLAGREFDRGIKRVQRNRELQRREREKARLAREARMREARLQREQEAELQKKKYMDSILHRNPNCKGAI
jgi:hypothetical protein